MNYYEHHLGDYAAATAHLSWDEDMAYTRLLRAYYHHERGIPQGQQYRLARATTPAQRRAVDSVLDEFFTLTGDTYTQKRADQEIARYQDKQRKAQASANARWSGRSQHSERNANAPPDAMRTHSEGNAPRHQTPYSVPNGTGVPPDVGKSPEDQTKRELWEAGASLLEQQGMPKPQCRSFVGKLVKDHGQQIVVEAVRAAVVAQPADAAEYLVETCRRSAGLRKDPMTVPSKAAEETQAMLAAKQLTPEQRAASEEARRRVMAGIRRVT